MSERPAPRRRNVGRLLGHIAVAIVILAVIAAAFALSYNPVRDIARDAGVANYLVRIYPGILDAVFLVTCGCALMLRGARWWTRLFAWLSVLVTGALIGAADVYHAAGLRLPRRTLDGTVWALPWALILLAFSLWVSTLQHAKTSRPAAPEPAGGPSPDPQLALAAPQATRALPAADLARTGGLSDVGFGQRPATENPENVAGTAESHKPAESHVAGEARDAAQTGNARQPRDAGQDGQPGDAGEPGDAGQARDTGQAEDTGQSGDGPQEKVTAHAGDAAESEGGAQPRDPAPDEDAAPAGYAPHAENAPQAAAAPRAPDTTQAPDTAQAADTAQTPDTPQAADTPQTPDTAQAADIPQAADTPQVTDASWVTDAPQVADTAENREAAEAEPAEAEAEAEPAAADAEPKAASAEPTAATAESADESEWPFEAEEPSPTEQADGTPAAAGTWEPAEDDTPAYGFPAVTEQDADGTPRMPTLLGAPVPADVAPDDVADRGARGEPPAAAADLPVDEAELSHDDHPSQDAAEDTQTPSGQPTHFERVRSTPTPPAKG